MRLPSTRNMTMPVGTLEPDAVGVTVAVKVTVWPAKAGFGEAVTVVVVEAACTVSVIAAERLGAKSAVPLNTAVTEWLPEVLNGALSTAFPPASRLALAIAMVPSKKVTVPEGVPVVLVTVADRWTVWPTDGALTSVASAVVVDAAAAGGVPVRKYSPMCLLAASVNQTLPFWPATIPVG